MFDGIRQEFVFYFIYLLLEYKNNTYYNVYYIIPNLKHQHTYLIRLTFSANNAVTPAETALIIEMRIHTNCL